MLSCGHHIITDGCKHCKELQAKWYKRLEKDFEDAESIKFDERPLKVWHNFAFSKNSADEIQAVQEYNDKALELLHTFKFPNKTIRRIWELHCQGLSRLKIELEIRNLALSYKQSQIRNIIKQLEREIEW